jgi:hypothetical protein
MAGVEPASERFDPRIYYERSRFIDLASQGRKRQNPVEAIRSDPKALFCSASRRRGQHSGFVTPNPAIGRRSDVGGRDLKRSVAAEPRSLRQRAEEQRRKCDCWHLIFCADFTRSAPLGSQSGTSLPRRDRNIPEYKSGEWRVKSGVGILHFRLVRLSPLYYTKKWGVTSEVWSI